MVHIMVLFVDELEVINIRSKREESDSNTGSGAESPGKYYDP